MCLKRKGRRGNKIKRRKRGGSECRFKRKKGEEEGVRGVAENRIQEKGEC
jgi:hypothetical protein